MPGTVAPRAAPLPPRPEHFGFTAVETSYGLFRMSVEFAHRDIVTMLKKTTSPGPVAQVLSST